MTITNINTLPTDSTNLQVTMQHKSGTALIWRDNCFSLLISSHKSLSRRDGSINSCELEDYLMLAQGTCLPSLHATSWQDSP